MHAIVSLLDETHYSRLEDLWRELESECGLAGVALTPLPHFTWHIAAEYDFKRLDPVLDELAGEARPFTVRTSGLGLFTGPSPVVYLPLIKDAPLAEFHRRIWERVEPAAIGSSGHYHPGAWMPHITLAYGDVDVPRLGCAMENLAFRPFNWQIGVDHLALVYQLSGQVGKMQSKHPFGGAVGPG